MNIRLIAFDLDGTLLNSGKTVSPRTKAALTRAAEHGVVLVPATGRLHRDLPADVASLPSLRYVIAINGAEVFDLKEDRLLYQAELDRTDALELMKYMDTLPAIYGWYQGGQGFISSRYYERMKDFAHAPWLFDSMRRAYTPTENPEKTLFEEESGPQKLQLYFRDMEARKKALEEIPSRFPQCAVSSSLPINIEVNAASATKGHALAFLAERLGIKPEETLAFGDGTNDISMLRQAGTGVAIGNPRAGGAGGRRPGHRHQRRGWHCRHSGRIRFLKSSGRPSHFKRLPLLFTFLQFYIQLFRRFFKYPHGYGAASDPELGPAVFSHCGAL